MLRRPMTVKAHVRPDSAAKRLPRTGSGAVARAGSAATKKVDIPAAIAIMNPTSRGRGFSRRSHGESRRTYSGAVDCRKIAFAAVVSLLLVTNRIIVVA